MVLLVLLGFASGNVNLSQLVLGVAAVVAVVVVVVVVVAQIQLSSFNVPSSTNLRYSLTRKSRAAHPRTAPASRAPLRERYSHGLSRTVRIGRTALTHILTTFVNAVQSHSNHFCQYCPKPL